MKMSFESSKMRYGKLDMSNVKTKQTKLSLPKHKLQHYLVYRYERTRNSKESLLKIECLLWNDQNPSETYSPRRFNTWNFS